jgi:hypothetical protein
MGAACTRHRAALAALDREQVLVLARLHTSTRDPNGYLSPLEHGNRQAALDALPPDRLPQFRAWIDAGRQGGGP